MLYEYGKRSLANLDTCDPRLQELAFKVLSYGVMDISVIEGHRSAERQQQLYKEHKSQLDGVTEFSNHQAMPSKAMDLLPYPAVVNGVNVWKDTYRLSVMVGLILAAAAELGIGIRTGSDWNGTGNGEDNSFIDFPHFELID